MYKLIVIAGPNRGSSYPVHEGETSIGRQTGNAVILTSSKVSKKHCVLVVNNGEVVLRDQGSSNGTFVNGILTKLRKLKAGDRISVGEFVMELREPPKRAPKSVPAVAGLGNVVQFPTGGPLGGVPGGFPVQQPIPMSSGASDLNSGGPAPMPKDIKGRLIWLFENRVMPFFYALNLKHEWRVLCMAMFGALVVGNLIISVYPQLQSSRATIVRENGRRARFMAQQIAERNAPYLAARAETKTEIGSTENAEGVELAVLTDLDSRIIAPSTKLNQRLTGGDFATAAIRARNLFREGRETGMVREIDNYVVAIEPVKVASAMAGRNVVVGMAIVAIDTSLSTPDLGEIGMIYSETLIMTGILALILLVILYRMTLKPFQILNEDMDKVLKGDMPQVTHEFKFQELNPLWDLINSTLQRVPKGGAGGLDGGLGGSSGPGIEEYTGPLRMIGSLSKHGVVVFDADRKIVHINPMFEEISGIRSESAQGQEMTQVARDQSLGALTSDILARTMAGADGVSEDYDFSGIFYKIHAAAFGSGGIARCYVLLAVKADA